LVIEADKAVLAGEFAFDRILDDLLDLTGLTA
jgi:hypothetical protein